MGWRFAFVALLALLAAPAARAGLGPYHEDERVGFKVRMPHGWKRMPTMTEERWIVGQYLSDKSDFYTDPSDGWTWDFKPQMTMIAFIDDVVKKRGVTAEETEDDGVIIEFNNPFKDYKDYLQRTYSGGGWYVSLEEEGDIHGVPVEMLEIKVEKLASTGPKRIVTWVFDLEDVKVAIQFEVLEGSYKKWKKDVYGSLKSFKKIKRTKELLPTTTGDSNKITFEDESKLTPEERAERRVVKEAAARRRAIESLPDDWEAMEIGRFLVLNHADKKYAKELVKHVDAVWNWLDDHLGYIGEGEYVAAPIIRICANQEEQSALFSASTTWGSSLEIVTYKDTSAGKMSWAWEKVNRAMLRIWFSQRDPDLWIALPYWLDNGFRQVLGTARAKGKKLEFHPDQWELEGLREAARGDALTPPSELMLLPGSEFYDEQTRSHQAAAFLRFLLEAKSKKTRRILEDYLKNLKAVITEIEEKEDAADATEDKPPETEEEEEERYRERRERWKKKETEMLQSTFDRTFGDWKDRDWSRFRKLYFKSVS